MQTHGSLARHSLGSLLQEMQAERATGTLMVSSPEASCSLHLLFGHIFHAAGDAGRGAEAVISALSWCEGEFRFNPRATLPHDQTITMSTRELIAEAERRRRPAPSPEESWRPPTAPPAGAAGPDRLYPLPAGTPVCAGLSSNLVDLDRLLRTLEGDQLTGYLRLQTRDFTGVLMLAQGRVLEACCSPGTSSGGDTLQQLRRQMDGAGGRLAIVALSAEAVVALSQLISAPPLLAGLLGRFVDFERLLEYLGEERVDGSMVVDAGAETGVMLLSRGVLIGTYTSSEPALTASPMPIRRLALEGPARIEVRGRTVRPVTPVDTRGSSN